jgi:hypothetical protein
MGTLIVSSSPPWLVRQILVCFNTSWLAGNEAGTVYDQGLSLEVIALCCT